MGVSDSRIRLSGCGARRRTSSDGYLSHQPTQEERTAKSGKATNQAPAHPLPVKGVDEQDPAEGEAPSQEESAQAEAANHHHKKEVNQHGGKET